MQTRIAEVTMSKAKTRLDSNENVAARSLYKNLANFTRSLMHLNLTPDDFGLSTSPLYRKVFEEGKAKDEVAVFEYRNISEENQTKILSLITEKKGKVIEIRQNGTSKLIVFDISSL